MAIRRVGILVRPALPVLFSLFVMACSPAPQADGPVVKLTMDEWDIHAPATLPAGPNRFEVDNEGLMTHEIIIVRTDVPIDQLPVVDANVDEAALGDTFRAEIGDAPPGDHIANTVDLAPGRYVLFCNIAGHYVAGMHTALVVTP